MIRNKLRISALLVLSFALCFHSAVVRAESTPAASEASVSNPAVTEWFAKYDRIRSDAEMATSEKLKYGTALKKALKSGGKLSPGAQDFIKRMAVKYAAASAALSALTPPAETKELQEGYVHYFNDMEKNFKDCLETEEISPATSTTKAAAKEAIETLNNANKKLDYSLRKQFGIPKHKRG
jgi:hypothetical protein